MTFYVWRILANPCHDFYGNSFASMGRSISSRQRHIKTVQPEAIVILKRTPAPPAPGPSARATDAVTVTEAASQAASPPPGSARRGGRWRAGPGLSSGSQPRTRARPGGGGRRPPARAQGPTRSRAVRVRSPSR